MTQGQTNTGFGLQTTARGATLARRLTLLALVSALPLFAYSLLHTYVGYRADRERAAARTLELARSTVVAVDRELQSRMSGLRALAVAPALVAGDLAGFESQARAFLASGDASGSLALSDQSGLVRLAIGPHGLMNGGQTDHHAHEVIDKVFATGEAAVSNFQHDAVSNVSPFSVDVPVRDAAGRVAYDLSLNPDAGSLIELIRGQRLPNNWVISIFDAEGVNVARFPNGELFSGHPASARLLPRLLADDEGILDNVTLEGVSVVTAFSHSKAFGWSVAIGLPREDLLASAWRSAAITFATGLALTVLALALARMVAGQIARPIDRLRAVAADSHASRLSDEPTGLPETDELARALVRSAASRDAAEAALAASERRTRALIEAAAQVFWNADADGRITDDSPTWRAFTGQTAGQWLGAGRLHAIHPEDRERVSAHWHQCIETRQGYEHEYRLAHCDGSWRWVTSRAVLVPDGAGGHGGWVGMITDISARRTAEDARADSENRLRLAREAAGFGVWDWEMGTNQIRWTVDQWRMHGLPEDEHSDGPSFEIWCATLDPRDRDRMLAELMETVGEPSRVLDTSYRVVWPDGGVRWLMARGQVMRDPDGAAVRMVGINTDITARKADEEALRSLTRDLEARVAEEVAAREAAQARAAQSERMQALGQLAGGVAHDFNNVLQAIQSGAGLVERRADDPVAVRRLAGMLLGSTERGVSVTRRLLSIARSDQLNAEPIDATSLLDGLCEVLSHILGAGVRCEVRSGAPDLPPLLADKGQLEAVLINLATNARDAMPDGGTITFSASVERLQQPGDRASGLGIRLDIADAGVGMDAATLARATEPFFTTKPVGRGTGLGLSMARSFVERSNGRMTVTSEPGKGTKVSIVLPALTGRASLDGGASPSRDGADAPRRGETDVAARILLVDDDTMVREVLHEQLAIAGYDVIAVPDGPTGLSMLGDMPVDVLITDLSMPAMDGIAMIRAAQALRPDLPAILLTGFADEGAALAATGAMSGAFSLLRKPITAEALARRVGELLAERRQAGTSQVTEKPPVGR